MSDAKKSDATSDQATPKSLRDSRPPEYELPEVLAKMPADKRQALFRAFMRLAMERGAAKIRANPGLLRKH